MVWPGKLSSMAGSLCVLNFAFRVSSCRALQMQPWICCGEDASALFPGHLTAPIVRHSSKVDLKKPVKVLPSTIYIQVAFSQGESGQEMFLSTVAALVSKSLPSEGDSRHQFAPHETGQTPTSVLMHRQKDVFFLLIYLCQNYIYIYSFEFLICFDEFHF